MYSATNWTSVIVTDMLGAIVTARLHAMYHGSRMLTFLIVIFLALNISCGVLVAIGLKQVIGEEVILSGTHVCSYDAGGNAEFLTLIIWILIIAWEVLALCLVLWIAVKQFRDLRRLRLSAGSIIVDMFTVLAKSHIRYFASFLAVACLQLRRNSPNISVCQCVTNIAYDPCSLFCRVRLSWKLRYMMVLFNFCRPCRCLCWDHALSLLFENIMLSS